MIKAEIKNGTARIEMYGKLETLTADILVMIKEMYDAIKKKTDKECADFFIKSIKDNVDYCKDIEKLKKDVLNSCKLQEDDIEDLYKNIEKLQSLIDILNEIKKNVEET